MDHITYRRGKAMTETYGDDFQEKSKYHRHHLPHTKMKWNNQPPPYKTYPEAQKHQLPSPTFPETPSLFEILQTRKSIRQYQEKSLNLEHLSNLLWATTGIQRTEHNLSYRTAPSAGALYPIETYLIINNIKDLTRGIYHYDIQNHQLENIKSGDFRKPIAQAALDQPMCATASVVLIWTANFNRSKWKYNQRGYRYIYLDCGHIAENLALAATSLGLGSCQIAALYDDEINALLDIDGDSESVIYLSSVGFIMRIK
jgi:SagB-type dehydrogenase family enzyme